MAVCGWCAVYARIWTASGDSWCTLHNALPLSTIKAIVASAARGFLTKSKRGRRIFRKVAGGVCGRAKDQLGPDGLRWTKAAWVGGLRAAMAGLEALAGTPDAGLQQGFKEVLTSIAQAHLEGLQQQASAPCRGHRTSTSPAPASPAAVSQSRAPAGGTSRKARKAREELASYLFGDKVPHGLLCGECSNPATFGVRGGKEGGNLKCFCGLHRPFKSCFQIETARAAKLLLIGGVESNPGWPASKSQWNEDKDLPVLDVGPRRQLVILPSREDVERSWRPASAQHAVQRDIEAFEKWRKHAELYKQVDASRADSEGDIAARASDHVVPGAIERLGSTEGMPSAAEVLLQRELSHQDRIEDGLLTALVEDNGVDAEDRRSTSMRGIAGIAVENVVCGTTTEESGGNQLSATSAASASGSMRSRSEEEGEDIEGAEFESMGESSDEETSQDRDMIDDKSQDEENLVIARGRMRAAQESDSEVDVSQLLGRRFKLRAPGQATKMIQAASPPSRSESSAESGSSASHGRCAGALADRQLAPTAMETDSESDELPVRRKRLVSDGATRSPQTRRRRWVLLSSSESSGENGNVWARQSDAAGLDEEVQQRGGNEPVPGDSASSDDPPELEDDGSLDEVDFGEEFTNLCVIVPRLRQATISQELAGRDGFIVGGKSSQTPVGTRMRTGGPSTVAGGDGRDAAQHVRDTRVAELAEPQAVDAAPIVQVASFRRLSEGEVAVHSEHDGRLLTTRTRVLGTFFFAKRKFTREPVDYRDSKDGPQGFCRRYGEVLGHRVEVRRLCPSREFGSYPDWPTAYPNLRGQRHLEEAIKAGCPCKPYLDLERDGGLAEGETLETVIQAFEAAIKDIFREDYNIELPPNSFNWLPCDYGPGGKFSLHLVVSTHSPQFVFHSNLAAPADHQGAGHLAKELARRLPPRYAELIDQSVYTRNRGIRLPYCSKLATPRSRLIPLDESKPNADACITWLDEHVQINQVPTSLPDAVAEPRRPRTRPEHFRYQNATTASAYTAQRCTELVQTLHPTAYRRGSLSASSLNFSWHDRNEPCYSGNVHEGSRDILVIADPKRNAVFAKCDSARLDAGTGLCCKELPARYLGPFYADVKTWKDGAVEVNMRYLERKPLAAAPMDLQLIRGGFRDLTDMVVFNDVLNKWQAGRYKAALIRSPMDTAKSTTTRAIIQEPPRPETALAITYRQTQASDAAGKNPDFAHYGELKTKRGREVGERFIEPLADRELYPRVICQVDSLPRLLGDQACAPAFDLVILDESESILAHLSADTLSYRQVIIRLIVELLRRVRRVICLDGHLGQRTFDFMTLHGIRCSPMIINKHVPERPLQFEFLEGRAGLQIWESGIFEALEAGQNVFAVSMSSDRARDLGSVVAERGLVDEGQILVITRHSHREVKRGLGNVNESWAKRLVIISPTVEAGVDFNQPWFHRMFLYICRKSTHPRGLDQMKGRVRQLVDPMVLCFVGKGINLPTTGPEGSAYRTVMGKNAGRVPRLGVEETYQWFLNRDEKVGAGVFCEGATTRLLAHNEKELFNGRTHFYEEFTELLESDGHVVRGVRVLDPAVGGEPGRGEQSRGKFTLEQMIAASDITPGQFAAIEGRVRRNEDYPGERVQLKKYQLAHFYRVRQLDANFLRTFGPYPNLAVEFILQVVVPRYESDSEEIGRQRYGPQKAEIAKELLQVMGFPHPLAHEHVTRPLAELREELAATSYFRDYSETVKLFQARALPNQDVLAKQKSATIALNHVFSELGLQLVAMQNSRLPRNAQGRRGARIYGGWKMLRKPKTRTRPVDGPVGVDLMAQLLKLRLKDSPALKSRIVPAALREYVDGVHFRWPAMVNQDDECQIVVRMPRS
ncbi:replication origin binding protein [Klebsormidium nitens]|uniref:Replication origin binding protein n=1 Tax=Klebsormidium nitens TaxID=105231 RepID=A0A0U9HKD2_KLENI|nr:replication origin binding protein [Klebsormidium nitens]|eukprot:GAQ86657.1 replication origin binding protein [Klebsormidium nitens]